MKKIFALIIFFLCFIQVSSAIPSQMRGDIQSKRLKEGTIIKLKLLDPLTSQEVRNGDEFSLITVQDIRVDKKMVLPVGTMVRANVSKIQRAKRLSKDAILYVNFDHLITPQGRQLPIKAGIYGTQRITLDGGISDNGNYGRAVAKNWQGCCDITQHSTMWGVETGEDILGGSGKFVLTPIGAIGGVIGGGAYFFGDSIADIFKKGNNIILQPGEIIEIMLIDPLDIPVS